VAAANAIGSGSVILTANADGLTSGLDKAAKDVTRWGGRVQKNVAGAGKGGILGGLVGSAAKGLATGVGFGVGRLLVSGITGAMGGGAGGGLDGIEDRLKELGRAGDTARVFGMSAEAFTGMAGAARAAGSNQREFIESLVTVGKLGKDAANGTETAAKAFQMLGLNAADFNNLNTEDKYYTIMDAISRVTNETDRMYLAGVALGEDGMKNLLPLIGKTGDELRKMGGEFKRSNADIAAAQSASLAMAAANASMQQAFDSLVIALAPAFEYVSVLIPMAVDALGSNFQGMGDVVTPVLRGVSVGVGYLWDAIKAGGGIVLNIGGTIVETFGMLGEIFSDQIKEILGFADGAFRELKGIVAQLPEGVKMLSPALMAVDAMSEDTFSNMAKGLDGTSQKWQETGREMAERGKGMVDSFGQSAAAAGAFFDDFEARRAAGLAPKAGIHGPPKPAPVAFDPPKLAGAMEKGTADAYRAVLSHQFSGLSDTGDEQKKQTRIMDRVEGVMKDVRDILAERLNFDAI
jgi:hypothetical protein